MAVMEITLLLKSRLFFGPTKATMNKKGIFSTIGILALIASIAMYVIGGNSSHLTELRDYWWIPLIVAALCLVLAGSSKPKA